jgi:hypothetical protein
MIKALVRTLVLASLALFVAGKARADGFEAPCTVSTVGLEDDTNATPPNPKPTGYVPQKVLYVVCLNNTTHLAWWAGMTTANGGCPQVSLDTVKLWQSQAMAAKLSGKPVTIYYNSITCAGASQKRVMTGIEQN